MSYVFVCERRMLATGQSMLHLYVCINNGSRLYDLLLHLLPFLERTTITAAKYSNHVPAIEMLMMLLIEVDALWDA